MSGDIQVIGDGEGLALIGNPTDIERFLCDAALEKAPSRELDLHRLDSLIGTGGAAAKVGAELAENSGRWVKLTRDSAKAIHESGLMPTKKAGIFHAMIGKAPGHSKRWLQIERGPTALLSGPVLLGGLSTMMQQYAMQQQMDEMLEYLREINEKVDDILRGQKDSVLADMIGVDLIIEDALCVRDQVGRVSEVTWSKVQATSMTIARTEAYAIRQLDAIAERLQKKADIGEIAKAARDAEPRVREWLAVLARCFQLQDGIWVLELDRVLDSSPQELESHRLGLMNAREKRLETVTRTTARLLMQMNETCTKANSKVLFNPLKSPAIVRSGHQVAADVVLFRGRLGVESAEEIAEAKRWSLAAVEARDKVLTTTADGVGVAYRVGSRTLDQAAGAFRAVDRDGDGVPDKPVAFAAMEDAGTAAKVAASGAADVIGSGANAAGAVVGGLVAGAAGGIGSLLQRKKSVEATPTESDPSASEEPEQTPGE